MRLASTVGSAQTLGRMTALLCPNCQERLSSVEQGYGGVWSCVYCEGSWLSAEQVASHLKTSHVALPGNNSAQTPRSEPAVPAAPLACPVCTGQPLSQMAVRVASCCKGCGGVFLQRGALQFLAPGAVSGSGEAPMASVLAGAIASLFVLDPAPILLALEMQAASPKNAA